MPCLVEGIGRGADKRPVVKTEFFALESAIYEIMAWERLFPGTENEEVEVRYAKKQFLCLGNIDIRPAILNYWKEVHETAHEVVVTLDSVLRS